MSGRIPTKEEIVNTVVGIIYPQLPTKEDILNSITIPQVIVPEKEIVEEKPIPTVKEIIQAIKNLKGNDRLDISHLRNGEQLARVAGRSGNQKIDMNDMRWHGSGGSSSSGTAVSNEVVAGSGTSFTLAHTPIAGSQRIFAIGQRLTPTVDYTIAGAVITTLSTWNSGDILADYTY